MATLMKERKYRVWTYSQESRVKPREAVGCPQTCLLHLNKDRLHWKLSSSSTPASSVSKTYRRQHRGETKALTGNTGGFRGENNEPGNKSIIQSYLCFD